MSRPGDSAACKRLKKIACQMARVAMQEAAGKYSSKVAMAKAMGVSKQTVNNWLKRGAPIDMCLLIEAETGVQAERLAPMHDWEQEREQAKKIAGGQC